MEKLKAGIVTFHRATNYGAVLQAYALQNALLKLGVKSEIIDNRCDRVDLLYSKNRPEKTDKNGKVTAQSVKAFVSWVLKRKDNKLKRYLFDNFIEQYLSISKKFDSRIELIKEEAYYDFFICGSDQVWNLGVTDSNGIYFLDFTSSSKKNSYAASLGSARIDESNINVYRKYLHDFQHVSVREHTNTNVLKEVYKGEITCVLDPTFLLRKEDWSKCCKPVKEIIPTRYILFYELYDMDNTSLHEFTNRLSKATNISIVHIGKNRKYRYKNHIDCVPAPEQWVWLFKNAEYIVTNSFHGTAFSINFHKEFFTGLLVPDERPANIRLNDILENVSLTDRKIDYSGNYKIEDLLHKKIKWDVVDRKLDKMRDISFHFLNQMVVFYKQ